MTQLVSVAQFLGSSLGERNSRLRFNGWSQRHPERSARTGMGFGVTCLEGAERGLFPKVPSCGLSVWPELFHGMLHSELVELPVWKLRVSEESVTRDKVCALVSLDCWNQMPQTGWFKRERVALSEFWRLEV